MFDRIVIVDWSANSTPKRGRDSIWIAVLDRRDAGSPVPMAHNLATRHEAERFVAALIDEAGSRRTLIGVDFSLGYPSGTAAGLGLAGRPWSAMWEFLERTIDDDHRNRNNRFVVAAAMNAALTGGPGPFWGCPPAAATPTLSGTKPPKPPRSAGLAEWRLVEDRLRESGWRPFSVWQLLGAGSVGSQSLVGVPVVARLGRRYGDRVQVWPFTTGVQAPEVAPGEVVVAEVWPSMLPTSAVAGRERDRVQVEATSRWLHDLDRAGQLGAAFAPRLDEASISTVVDEEGWVLGVDAELGETGNTGATRATGESAGLIAAVEMVGGG
jgi:hypothetical protein